MFMSVLYDIFFFSSRRRHTRFDCDWSSDVCSSDLPLTHFKKIRVLPVAIALLLVLGRAYAIDVSPDPVIRWSNEARKAIVPPSAGPEIGRASCRERV